MLPNCYSIADRTVAASTTVVPARDQKGNAVRVRAHYAAAAPATVGGESPANLPLGALFAPGKAAEGGDPRARTSATGNGHARARRAGYHRRERRVRLLRASVEGDRRTEATEIAVTESVFA